MTDKKDKIIDKGYGTQPKEGLTLTGELNYPEGHKYDGDLKSEQEQIPHGYGKHVATNENIHVGQWKNGKLDGEGTFSTLADTNNEIHNYKGEWKDNMKHGKGIYTIMNTKNMKIQTYDGQWAFDKYHGEGTLTEFDGEVKKGIWENGVLKNK